MSDSEEEESLPKRTEDWRWIYNGNGPLSVVSQPSSDGTFKRKGEAYYHYVLGSIEDERPSKPHTDAHTKVFVKIGVCQCCLNAGPVGTKCNECYNRTNQMILSEYGALREDYNQKRPPSNVDEINPLHVVQRLHKELFKPSAQELAMYYGPSKHLENRDEAYYILITRNIEDKLQAGLSESLNRGPAYRPSRKKRKTDGPTGGPKTG